jgi:hypothetical protein
VQHEPQRPDREPVVIDLGAGAALIAEAVSGSRLSDRLSQSTLSMITVSGGLTALSAAKPPQVVIMSLARPGKIAGCGTCPAQRGGTSTSAILLSSGPGRCGTTPWLPTPRHRDDEPRSRRDDNSLHDSL